VAQASSKRVIGWLRREARRGVTIGGLCTAAHTLAMAGLLDGKRATIHWENQDSFGEEFEEVTLTESVFVVDGNRLTTAGGTASIDLMLKLIADHHGEDLANAVADQLIYSSIRTDQDTQRLSIPTRIGVRHPKLSQVIQMMEGNIEDPMSPADLAEEVGMSSRQLERLFRRYLNRSPKRYYMELRLQKARKEEAKLRERQGAQPAKKAARDDARGVVEDLVPCPSCGAYVRPGSTCSCGRKA